MVKQLTAQKALDKYLYEAVASSKDTSFENISKIFLMALRDFYKNELPLKSLSSIATTLYYTFKRPIDFELHPYTRDLARALENMAEADYYLEEGKKDDSARKTYETIMKQCENYYEDNKHLIDEKSVDTKG